MFEALPRAYPATEARAALRSQPADFQVREQLSFEPSGAGEHVLLLVRKVNANTDWLASQIARFAGVPRRAVSYAGRKDRHALAEQWFSVHLPGRLDPDWPQFDAPGCSIQQHVRHNRKLRVGALQGNDFTLILRDTDGDWEIVQERVRQIATLGVPNYFGPQRFGINGSNLERAREWLAGQCKLDRNQRSLALSAARSWLFNQVLAARVNSKDWNKAHTGDVLELHGSHSFFLADPMDESIPNRVDSFDVHPTGPLWGQGKLPSQGIVAELEHAVAAAHSILADGLAKAGLKQERRALRLRPENLQCQRFSDEVFVLDFALPVGGFATSVLRELLEYNDVSLASQ